MRIAMACRDHEERRSRWRHLTQRKLPQAVFVLNILVPLIVFFVAFFVYPVARGFWGSFTQWRGFQPKAPFIGLDQYARAIDDPIFRISLRNTIYFTVLSVPANLVLAFVLAVAIEGSGRYRTFYRMVYFLPVVTSTIATALVWKWLYQPSFGLFNQLLTLAGLPTQRWLISKTQALPCVAIYTIWKDVGFAMVIFMAGFGTIPEVYREAARVDGANRWHVLRHITIPLLQPTILFTLVTGVIGSLQVFGPIYILTSGSGTPPGGPSNATMAVAVYQWMMAFKHLELGFGSAMAMILFLIILVLTVLQLRVLRTRWEY